MATGMTRAGAMKASLVAKAGLVVAAAAVFGVVVSLKDIPNPTHEPVDPNPPTQGGTQAVVRPVNFGSVGRSLTLAAEFPPEPVVEDTGNGDDAGGGGGPVIPSTPGKPRVEFLGAIAEPSRFVALLKIDGRQKFLGPGEMFGGVRVVECSATEVRVRFESGGGGGGGAEEESIAVSERSGPGWTAAVAGSEPVGDPTTAEGGVEMPQIPGMPPGFVPPANMTPEQIQMMRRSMEAAREAGRAAGDGSQ